MGKHDVIRPAVDDDPIATIFNGLLGLKCQSQARKWVI